MTTGESAGPRSFRAFIAVVPPESVRADIGRRVRSLSQRDAGDAVRWVTPDAVHITLAFLGQLAEGALPPLRDALAAETAGVAPFSLRAGGIGQFGSRDSRVIWAGLEGDLDALRELHARVSAAVTRTGLRVEQRAFQPHITLGRVRRGRHWTPNTVDSPAAPSRDFRVDGISLMESRLGRGPAVYVERASVPLSAAANLRHETP